MTQSSTMTTINTLLLQMQNAMRQVACWTKQERQDVAASHEAFGPEGKPAAAAASFVAMVDHDNLNASVRLVAGLQDRIARVMASALNCLRPAAPVGRSKPREFNFAD